jgi:exosome complex component RRP45
MRPPSPSIPEKDFFFAALDQNLRLDGREFLEARPLELSFGAELGHVECSLGKTRSAHVYYLVRFTDRARTDTTTACWRK